MANSSVKEVVFDLTYKPWQHQWDAHRALIDKYDVVWLCGGLGSGKTYESAQWLYEMATEHCPGIDGLLVEPDYDAFDSIFMRTFRACFPGEGVLWELKKEKGARSNSKNLVIYYIKKDGTRGESTIFVRSAHNNQIVQKIDGLTTVGYWCIDEPARMLCGKQAFEKCIGRGRVPTPLGRNPGLMVGSPRGLGHWTCEVMGLESDHPPHGYTVGYETPKPGYFVRACKTTDNEAHLGKGYADRMLTAYGQLFWEQECNASLVRSEGQIFPNFYPSVHVVPHSVALGLWDKVRKKRLGVDWGWTNPGTVLMMGTTGDDELIIVDEWYERRRQTEAQGQAAARFIDEYGYGLAECDPSEPANIAKWQAGYHYAGERYVIPAKPADNAWQNGIDNLRNLMLLRGMGDIDHEAMPIGNKAGAPRLYISDRCPNLARELLAYVEKPIKEGQAPCEGATGDDHAIDAARYGAQALITSWAPSGAVKATI